MIVKSDIKVPLCPLYKIYHSYRLIYLPIFLESVLVFNFIAYYNRYLFLNLYIKVPVDF